jgi:hypothetical protein
MGRFMGNFGRENFSLVSGLSSGCYTMDYSPAYPVGQRKGKAVGENRTKFRIGGELYHNVVCSFSLAPRPVLLYLGRGKRVEGVTKK